MKKVNRTRFGKIYQKFLILEILPFAFYKNDCFLFLQRVSKGGRLFLKDNIVFIHNKLIFEESSTQIYEEDLENLKFSNFEIKNLDVTYFKFSMLDSLEQYL